MSQQKVFGDSSNPAAKAGFDQSTDSSTANSSAFSKYTPEKMMPNPEKSAFYQARQGTPEHITGSDRKRGRRAMQDENSLDDILGHLTAKLNTLSTNEDEKRNDCTTAFIEVLGCSNSEATFYLESAAWDLEAAVVLWLESNAASNGSARSRYSYNDQPRPLMHMPAMPYNSLASSLNPHHTEHGLYSGVNKRYAPRDVPIADLPVDWKAVVNPDNGIIQFVHIPTGFRQSNVPPGYADITDEDISNEYRVRRNSSGEAVVDMTGEENRDDEDENDGDDEEGDSDYNDDLLGGTMVSLSTDSKSNSSGKNNSRLPFGSALNQGRVALRRQVTSDSPADMSTSAGGMRIAGTAAVGVDLFEPQPEHYYEGGAATMDPLDDL